MKAASNALAEGALEAATAAAETSPGAEAEVGAAPAGLAEEAPFGGKAFLARSACASRWCTATKGLPKRKGQHGGDGGEHERSASNTK